MKYPLHYYGDPILREKTVPVAEVTDEIRALSDDMIETLHSENGIGLAAPQIGRRESLCVVYVPGEYDVDEEGHRLNPDAAMPMVLINPEITEPSDIQAARDEGCLSIPDIYAEVVRPYEIRVRYLDREGVSRDERYRGLVARVIQHEVDHLNGILFIDRISHVKKIALRGRLKRLRRETEERFKPA